MYVSLSTWLYDSLPPGEVITRARAAGYASIEVSGRSWWDEWDWNEFVARADDAGLDIGSVHSPANHALPTRCTETEFRDFQRRFYERVSGRPQLIVTEHAPMDPDHIGQWRERLEFLSQLADSCGYTLAIENLPAPADRQVETLSALLCDEVCLTVDVVHAVMGGLDPEQLLSFGDRIVNVHCGGYDPEIPLGDWLPPGAGVIDWPAWIDGLRNREYLGALTVEMNQQSLARALEACGRIRGEVSGARNTEELAGGLADDSAIFARRYLEGLIDAVG